MLSPASSGKNLRNAQLQRFTELNFLIDCTGLFHRAIHQSGTSLDFWTINRDVKEQSKSYAKRLGCPTATSQEMISCMKKIDSTTLIAQEIEQRVRLAVKMRF